MYKAEDKSFQTDVLEAVLPSIVQFSANWCGPCKVLTPVMNKVSKEYEGKVLFWKMDVDHNPNTPVQYGIRGIPTLLIFKAGDVVGSRVGALSEADLKAFIDSNV